jgi:hypothetical protein
MSYGTSFEIYAERARTLLGAGTLTREQLVTRGLPLGALRMLQQNDIVRQKMTPWFNRDGRRIGAIEGWQLATVRSERALERLDCATMDFVALGIG